jgi:Na+/melibiose symporter-like transporter
VLDLSAAYAGIALSVTTLWDAVIDNTRRLGRSHPYLLGAITCELEQKGLSENRPPLCFL